MEIGPAHLISAGRRVSVGHGPPAKWPVPRAGVLGHPSPPGRAHGTATASVSTAPSIASPHVRPRLSSPLSVALTSKGEAKLHFTLPCSAAPPRCSAAHIRASHHRSGCAKATSSSTAQTWASSPNCWPALEADLNHPAPSLPSRSASPWTDTSYHGTAPPTFPRPSRR
jgi:hypothetical protein